MRVVTLHSKSRQTAVASLDFLRFNNQVLDLKKAVGKCMKVEFVNVRGVLVVKTAMIGSIEASVAAALK